MNIAFLLFATSLFACYSIFMKYVPQGTLRFTLLVTAIFAGLVSVMYSVPLLFGGQTISNTTIIWASIKGIITIITQVAYFAAMQQGSLAYTTFIFSSSMLIPTLGSALLWSERITGLQWCGIILFLIAFYLVSVPGGEKGGKIKRSWLLLALLAFFMNGFASIALKVQQIALNGAEGTPAMAISYAVTCGASILLFVVLALKQGDRILPQEMQVNLKKARLPILAVAICNGAANGFVTYLSSRISGAWLFPCVLGGSMVLVMLFSIVVLREKINKWGKMGVAVGLAAMIIMNIM